MEPNLVNHAWTKMKSSDTVIVHMWRPCFWRETWLVMHCLFLLHQTDIVSQKQSQIVYIYIYIASTFTYLLSRKQYTITSWPVSCTVDIGDRVGTKNGRLSHLRVGLNSVPLAMWTVDAADVPFYCILRYTFSRALEPRRSYYDMTLYVCIYKYIYTQAPHIFLHSLQGIITGGLTSSSHIRGQIPSSAKVKASIVAVYNWSHKIWIFPKCRGGNN